MPVLTLLRGTYEEPWPRSVRVVTGMGAST